MRVRAINLVWETQRDAVEEELKTLLGMEWTTGIHDAFNNAMRQPNWPWRRCPLKKELKWTWL